MARVLLNHAIRPAAMFLLVIAAFSHPGCTTDTPVVTGVQGTVTKIGSGAPVADVGILLVRANSMSPVSHLARTDNQGRYRIEGVAPDDYAVFLYHGSLTLFDRSGPLVRVTQGLMATHNMRLIESGFFPGGYRITGRVVDDATNRPIPGALVEPQGWALSGFDIEGLFGGYAFPSWGVTENDGRFSILDHTWTDMSGEEIGLDPITVAHEGYVPFTLVGSGERAWILGPPLPLPKDSVLSVTIRLRPLPAAPHGAIRGRVVNVLSGAPVANILVGLSVLMPAHPDTLRGPSPVPLPGRVATTGRDGVFEIKGLAPGTYAVTPAFPADDGFVAGGGYNNLPLVTIAEEDTVAVDAGDAAVVEAVRPLSPSPRAEVAEHSPEFRWEPLPPGVGYAVIDYELQAGTGFLIDPVAEHLVEPRWQGSVFAPGDHVRWTVRARVATESPPDTVRVFIFESNPTFTVAR